MPLAIGDVFELNFNDVVCASKHESMPYPQDTLGTSLFLLTLSFVAACIQIAYKSCMPLWQVIARHWVLEYPRVMLRKDI